MSPLRVAVALLVGSCATVCSDPAGRRVGETTKATYDSATGRLTELTYDANGNGRIDTWTEMDGRRPVRARIDRDEDGKLDRWEYYGGQGELLKVGFSRAGNGRPDAWAFPGSDGRIVRVDVSSTGNERGIDRWERYDPGSAGSDGFGVLDSVDEDTNKDGKPDKWETFEGGMLKTAAFDENHDGKPDRRLTYDAGKLVSIETEPDASGRYMQQLRVK